MNQAPVLLAAPAKELKWYALYTKGRHEKFVHAELARRRIDSFLPLRKIRRQWSDRSVIVEEPLFKSYLFVRTDWARASETLKTKGAVKFVSAASLPIPVQDGVITSLRHIVSSDIAADPFPYLAAGDRVRIRSGMFKDVEGFIVRKDDKKCRLVISIAAIMASISIEVDSHLVDKI